MRVLSFDISLGLPGAAIVEVKNGQAKIVAVSSIKTDSKTQSHGLRTEIVEAWATLFINEHVKKGFDVLIREDFHGQSSAQNFPVFSAWSGIERACGKFGLSFEKWIEVGRGGRNKTLLGIPQSKVKLIVFGKGKAEKDELAEAVRQITKYKGEFATFDESDACAIALAYLIKNGIITKE